MVFYEEYFGTDVKKRYFLILHGNIWVVWSAEFISGYVVQKLSKLVKIWKLLQKFTGFFMDHHIEYLFALLFLCLSR